MKQRNSCRFLNFILCQRADGTFYGTAGRCRKGREVAKAIRISNLVKQTEGKKPIGEGLFGKVFDIGSGIVVKIGEIQEIEIQAMDGLKHISGIPRAISASYGVSESHSVLGMDKAPGVPIAKLTRDDRKKAWDEALKLLKQVHEHGWAHMDFHDQNVLYDPKSREASIIDFGRAAKGPQMQLRDLRMISKFILIDKSENYGPVAQRAIQGFKELEGFWGKSGLMGGEYDDSEIQIQLNKFWKFVVPDPTEIAIKKPLNPLKK